jgi:hypothetical protein
MILIVYCILPGSPSDELVLEAASLELGVKVQSPDTGVGDSGLGRSLRLLEDSARLHTDLLYIILYLFDDGRIHISAMKALLVINGSRDGRGRVQFEIVQGLSLQVLVNPDIRDYFDIISSSNHILNGAAFFRDSTWTDGVGSWVRLVSATWSYVSFERDMLRKTHQGLR